MFYQRIKSTIQLVLLAIILTLDLQGQVSLDSMWGIWNDPIQTDSNKLKTIKSYCEGSFTNDPDSTFACAQIMFDLAVESGLIIFQGEALLLQALSYDVKSEFPKALEYYNRALDIFIEIEDLERIANSYYNIGMMHRKLGNYSMALDNIEKSKKIYEKLNDPEGIASQLDGIASIYYYKSDIEKCIDYELQALDIYKSVDSKSGMAKVYNGLGLSYEELGDFTEALKYLEESLKLNNELGNQQFISYNLNNLGKVYQNRGRLTIALDYFQRSLKIKKEVGDKWAMAESMLRIGQVNQSLGNNLKAIKWCNESLEISNEINEMRWRADSYYCLYKAYKNLNQNSKALDHHELFLFYKDSLQKDETTKKLQQMEFAKQVLADSLLQEEENLRIQIAHDEEIRKKNRTKNVFIGTGVLILLLAGGLWSRLNFIRKSRAIIQNEKDRSDHLLLNILPAEVADELKEKGEAEAKSFQLVSVLFTDFQEFTKASEKLTASELVKEINHCYKGFDTIIEKFGIEKIKTIGDSYMAAGGLPVPADDSVKNTVMAALYMQDFIAERKKEKNSSGLPAFEMRVGIHTGPVVAGIVGVKKFQYDLWGDTVNIASRIENNGEVGKVNISHSTYELIKDDPQFSFKSRGKISAKGKGEIDMYFVINK